MRFGPPSLFPASQVRLASGVAPEEEDGGLAEGPPEVGVADPGAARPRAFARTAVLALHEPRIRSFLHRREATDVVNLVEQGQHRARAVEHAQVQRTSMKIDAAVVFMLVRGALCWKYRNAPQKRREVSRLTIRLRS